MRPMDASRGRPNVWYLCPSSSGPAASLERVDVWILGIGRSVALVTIDRVVC